MSGPSELVSPNSLLNSSLGSHSEVGHPKTIGCKTNEQSSGSQGKLKAGKWSNRSNTNKGKKTITPSCIEDQAP